MAPNTTGLLRPPEWLICWRLARQDELDDDSALQQYRAKRIAELREKAVKERFGDVRDPFIWPMSGWANGMLTCVFVWGRQVMEITKADWVKEVTEASKSCWVVVHLYQDR